MGDGSNKTDFAADNYTICIFCKLWHLDAHVAENSLNSTVTPETWPDGTPVSIGILPPCPAGISQCSICLPVGGKPKGCVIYIHGGGLSGGTKDWVAQKAVASLVPEGYAIAALEYRFVSRAPLSRSMDDCKEAYRWPVEQGRDYGLDQPVSAYGATRLGRSWLGYSPPPNGSRK